METNSQSPMTEDEARVAIEEALAHLEHVSYVAHRDVKAALPSVEPLGAQATLAWIESARDLFFYDRDAGKAFIRETPATIERVGGLEPWMAQALAFARRRGTWKALEEFISQVGDVYRAWGEDGEQRWFAHGEAWLDRHVDSAVAYFQTPFESLSGGEGIAGVDALLEPAAQLFDERRLPLSEYLEGALRVRDQVGIAGVVRWARRGADIMAAGRQRGEAYFRLETDESADLLLESVPGYSLREHGRLLQLIAQAWFGEVVPMADAGWRPDHGRPRVETDGRRLFLPAVLGDRDESMLAVLHHVGHLRFGTYDQEAIEALFGEVGMAHPPLDEDQRITWRPLFAAWGEDLFRFQLVFDLCEDLRVDARVAARVPGYLDRLARRAESGPLPDGAARAYYEYALACVRGVLGREPLDDRLRSLLDEAATLVDAFRIARELYAAGGWPAIDPDSCREAYLPGRSQNAARPVYPRRVDAQTGDTEHAESAAATTRAESKETKPAKCPRDGQGDPDQDSAPENTSGSGGRIGVGIPEPAQVIARGVVRRPNLEGMPYPEWDYREQRYIPDWARVQERRVEERDAARAEAILADHANVLKRLRRALQMQRPNRPAPLRRQSDGDDLDIDAAVDYVVEKRAGRSPRPWVYRRRALRHRETAVLLLADMSTSIMQRAKRGEGKVVDRLRSGLLLFGEALREVGDPYAICGFASKYHDNVGYYRIKDFEQRIDADARAALAGLSGRLASRMGAAIRHSITLFDDIAAQQRLLLILSDGRPADYDDGGDERYLHEDTRMAMKEAVDAGIHPFCVTLDPAGSEYLPAIFGPGHYMVVDNVDELPQRLPEIYMRLRR